MPTNTEIRVINFQFYSLNIINVDENIVHKEVYAIYTRKKKSQCRSVCASARERERVFNQRHIQFEQKMLVKVISEIILMATVMYKNPKRTMKSIQKREKKKERKRIFCDTSWNSESLI